MSSLVSCTRKRRKSAERKRRRSVGACFPEDSYLRAFRGLNYLQLPKEQKAFTFRYLIPVFQAKKEFMALLAEQTSFTRKTKWSTAKKLLENDERFKAVESSSSREQMFRDHVEKLGDESLSVSLVQKWGRIDPEAEFILK